MTATAPEPDALRLDYLLRCFGPPNELLFGQPSAVYIAVIRARHGDSLVEHIDREIRRERMAAFTTGGGG